MTSVGKYTIARSWQLTPRLISAFAAGVDDPNPCYLDDARDGGLIGHPGLAFTFQWNTRHMPDVPVDMATARFGVHAWADIRFARPFRQGDVITARGQVISQRQVAPGALTVHRITMSDSAGCDVAVMDSGGLLRGIVTGEPDESIAVVPPLPEPAALPASAPVWSTTFIVPRHAAHAYTECADIWNPIHTERAVALAAGLPDIILHGSATMTIALREVINRSLGRDPTRVARLAGQFRAMVIPGEELTIESLEERDEGRGHVIFYRALNHSGQTAIARGVVVTN